MDRPFRHELEDLEIVSGRVLRIDRTALETIDRARKRTPEDRFVVVAGQLETNGQASRPFELDLSSGDRVKGIVVNEPRPPRRSAQAFSARARTVRVAIAAQRAIASFSVLGYDHHLTEPAIQAWNR